MVREALVRPLANPFTNPIFVRPMILMVCSAFAFLMGVIFIRMLKQKIQDETDLAPATGATPDALPMHLYNTVIQQLKQQKHELDVQSKTEQNRARITETFSHAVLSQLSSGVLVFGPNGLIKTSNPAAKQILGFASATGMSAKDIFRGAVVNPAVPYGNNEYGNIEQDENESEHLSAVLLSDEVDAVLHQGSGRRQVEAEYETPAGVKRFIAVTFSPVPAEDGNLLGVACVVNDVSAAEHIRRERELHEELSAEKALQLRSSLATISGCARQLANDRDGAMVAQIANDIAREAEQLECTIGGFLREGRAAAAAAGSAR
jgi:PAS domain-containing protein